LEQTGCISCGGDLREYFQEEIGRMDGCGIISPVLLIHYCYKLQVTYVTPLHSCPLGEVGCELEPEVLTSESEPSTCSSVTVQFNNYASLATDHSRCTKCIVLNNLNKTAVLLCVGIKVPENLTRYDLLISQWEQENVGHVAHEVVT